MGTTATSVLGAHPPSRSHLVIPQLLESSWGSKLTQPTANSPVPAVSRCFHIGIPRWVKCWVSRWWGRPEISGFFRFSIDANSPCQMLKVMVAFFSLHLPPQKLYTYCFSLGYKLLMVQKSGVSPADMVRYTIIYKGLYIPGAGCFPSTVWVTGTQLCPWDFPPF